MNSKKRKSIGIFANSVIESWDPDSIKSGIHGSEESIIYMAEQLARLNYDVQVFAVPPKNSVYTKPGMNPRYVPFDFDKTSTFDIAISWRNPFGGKNLKKRAKTLYLWPHDTHSDPISQEAVNLFDDVLWLSHWQRTSWISVNPCFERFTRIFGNGINPDQFHFGQKKSNPHSCIYASNYARGLEILFDVWPEIKQRFPNATLDIYYGWEHYGLMPTLLEPLLHIQLKRLESLGVTEHGKVGHEELNRAFERTSLWTYPCIKLETFCITALRAQLTGALPVIISGSALNETVRHGFKCATKEEYQACLVQAMEYAEKISQEERDLMGKFILDEFTWEKLAHRWSELFESVKKE